MPKVWTIFPEKPIIRILNYLKDITMKKMNLYCFIITIFLISLAINTQMSFGQSQIQKPLINIFYPEHGARGEDFDSKRIIPELGKWQTDTVECYIVKFADTVLNGSNFEIADTIFTKAINEWNSSGMKLYLKKININSRVVRKNLFSFDNRLIRRGDTVVLGATVPIEFDTTRINNILYYIPEQINIELNRETWNKTQGLKIDSRKGLVDVFASATHELGHFIGFGNHDYPNGSIMEPYLDLIPFIGLKESDKKIARAFYPNILPQHQNNCTPR